MKTQIGGAAGTTLGQGTWHMGEAANRRSAEIDALRTGIELGLTMIDTAEMYGDGGAESVLGEAIAGRRDGLTLVSKVLPSNAGYNGVLKACDRSRKRLGVDTIDWYLLHWASGTPMSETIDAFETLRASGAINGWGVSNFDHQQMDELLSMPGGDGCVTNQVYYSLGARGIEFDLLPLLRERGLATMAYCPLDQGQLTWHEALLPIADRHGASCAQIALAWLLHQPGVIVIPKSSSADHVRENAAARDILFSDDDLLALDNAFAPPDRAEPLSII